MTYLNLKKQGALIMVLFLLLITTNYTWGRTTDSCFSPKIHDIFYTFSEKYPSKVYYILSERCDTCTIITLGTSGSYPKDFTDYYMILDNKLINYLLFC